MNGPIEAELRTKRWLLPSVLAAVFVAATALRVFGVTDWSLDGDEISTLRDSVNFKGLDGPKPLLFLLNQPRRTVAEAGRVRIEATTSSLRHRRRSTDVSAR